MQAEHFLSKTNPYGDSDEAYQEQTVALVDPSRAMIDDDYDYDFEMPVFGSDFTSLDLDSEPFNPPDRYDNGGSAAVNMSISAPLSDSKTKAGSTVEHDYLPKCADRRNLFWRVRSILTTDLRPRDVKNLSGDDERSHLPSAAIEDIHVECATSVISPSSGAVNLSDPRSSISRAHLPSLCLDYADESTSFLKPKSIPPPIKAEGSLGGRNSFVDSGHRHLLSSVSTTSKFTHKWPRPLTIQRLSLNLERSVGKNDCSALASAVQESKGLGLEYMSKWTKFKWCLTTSVLLILLLGGLMLTSSILTWFGGQCDIFQALQSAMTL